MSLDPPGELRLIIKSSASKIARITSDGNYEPVRFEREGEIGALSLTAGLYYPPAPVIE